MALQEIEILLTIILTIIFKYAEAKNVTNMTIVVSNNEIFIIIIISISISFNTVKFLY